MPAEGTRRTIDDVLAAARAVLDRLEPHAAHDAVGRGALLVDIRQDTSRLRDGVIPGALHLPRTVLEWRADPDSPFRNPHVGGLDRQLILVCDHGYSSSLAAVSLVELGFAHATDLVGGFRAWRDAGMPVARLRQLRWEAGMLAGTGPPDS
jgi:rhodanese-related sulfurtransferase